MPEISKRLGNFSDSVIRRMTRIAQSCDAINLSQGFPDFGPPAELIHALEKAARDGVPGSSGKPWLASNQSLWECRLIRKPR